jgi:hypothetical protein
MFLTGEGDASTSAIEKMDFLRIQYQPNLFRRLWHLLSKRFDGNGSATDLKRNPDLAS